MECSDFLSRAGRLKPQPLYVVHGDEDFLKRQVLAALKSAILGPDPDGLGLCQHVGDKATMAEVRDDLDTIPFLGPRRLVLVENADPFVTRFRAALEKLVGEPAATNVLVLDVRTWTATTRLAKMVDSASTIVCKAPAAYKLPDWCVAWSKSRYETPIRPAAARLLVDLTGTELGVLDQELAKLSIYVGTGSAIDVDDVDQLVGRSRTANVFKIFDAIGAGKPREALVILDELFVQGEDAMRMLGAFSLQLRRLAQAAHLAVDHQQPLAVALATAGVPPFGIKESEQQLRHLGRDRASRLYDWLLEMDQGLKGYSQLPPRVALETLIVRLARKA